MTKMICQRNYQHVGLEGNDTMNKMNCTWFATTLSISFPSSKSRILSSSCFWKSSSSGGSVFSLVPLVFPLDPIFIWPEKTTMIHEMRWLVETGPKHVVMILGKKNSAELFMISEEQRALIQLLHYCDNQPRLLPIWAELKKSCSIHWPWRSPLYSGPFAAPCGDLNPLYDHILHSFRAEIL